MRKKLKALFNSVIIAGIIVIVIGVYFWMFKAGLPYQDPTTEMTIKWMSYNFAGKACLTCGIVAFLFGVLGKVCCYLFRSKK